jgi:hypothetical protein
MSAGELQKGIADITNIKTTRDLKFSSPNAA